MIEEFNPTWKDLSETCYQIDNPYLATFEKKFDALPINPDEHSKSWILGTVAKDDDG